MQPVPCLLVTLALNTPPTGARAAWGETLRSIPSSFVANCCGCPSYALVRPSSSCTTGLLGSSCNRETATRPAQGDARVPLPGGLARSVGPTPRCEYLNRSGVSDRVSARSDAALGGRFRSYRVHHSNDSVLGPAVRALQPQHLATVAIGDSPHGIRGGAGPAPNTRYEVHSTPFSLRPLASHNQQSAL